MPNHCFNKIEIYGKEASKIASKIESEETPFDFTKIFPEPDYDKYRSHANVSKRRRNDFRMTMRGGTGVYKIGELNGTVTIVKL
jgi:hypothetical protein